MRTDAVENALSLADLYGQPAVLAFVEHWTADDCEAHLAAISAHLRGLGVVLVVLSPEGAWYFRPDGDVESVGHVDALLAEVDRRCGARRRGGRPVVHVLDASGAPCCRLEDTTVLPPSRIVAALAEARRSAAAQKARVVVPIARRDRVVTHLVSGFALAFAAGLMPVG